jgi:hypothetical protein
MPHASFHCSSVSDCSSRQYLPRDRAHRLVAHCLVTHRLVVGRKILPIRYDQECRFGAQGLLHSQSLAWSEVRCPFTLIDPFACFCHQSLAELRCQELSSARGKGSIGGRNLPNTSLALIRALGCSR